MTDKKKKKNNPQAAIGFHNVTNSSIKDVRVTGIPDFAHITGDSEVEISGNTHIPHAAQPEKPPSPGRNRSRAFIPRLPWKE